jgi:hypothetical protein
MPNITKLTAEQESQIPVFIQKWVGKASAQYSNEEMKEAVLGAYGEIKAKPPKILVFDSPLACHLACAKLQQKGGQLRDQLDDQLRGQLRDQLRDQLGQLDQLNGQLRDQLLGQLGQLDQLDGQLRGQLGQLDDQLRGQLRDQLGQLDGQLINFWRLVWLGYADYFRYIGGKLEWNKKLENFVEKVSFGLYFEGVCLVSRAPISISWANGRLHNDSGPSVLWKDGYALHNLNGVRFDKELFNKVISPEFSFADRMKIEDVDQRTQAINPKYCDINAFLKETKAELLDEVNKFNLDGEPVNYKLYKIPKGNIFTEDAYYCYFDCPSTGKKHLEGVEVSKTVAEAMSWAMSVPEIGMEVTAEEWSRLVPLVDEN